MAGIARRWTRDEVDHAIETWNRTIQVAMQNVLELLDDLSYKRLAGDGGLPTLEGATEQRVTPVLAALDELWQALPMLSKWLDEVNTQFHRLPWFKATTELAAIQQLLDGESIKIVTKTTYAQRGLLTPDEVTHSVKPARLLAAMEEAYANAKAVIVEVDAAMLRLDDRLDRASRELAALSALAASQTEAAAELDHVAAQLTDARRQAARDPLGATAAVDGVAAELARLGQRLAATQVEHARLETELAAAGARLAALEAAFATAKTAHDERLAKIAIDGDPHAPFAHAVIEELARWLERLRSALGGGNRAATQLGLANWTAQLDARLADSARVAAENQRLLDHRRELRGLLDGFKAKAVATGLAEDPEVTELYRRAYALLYSNPTPITAATQLVADYVAAVR
jgi:hypothetical protein